MEKSQLTKENPDRVSSFLMPNLTVLNTAFFENFMNGRNPNEVMFNTSGCFDTYLLKGIENHGSIRPCIRFFLPNQGIPAFLRDRVFF